MDISKIDVMFEGLYFKKDDYNDKMIVYHVLLNKIM